MRNIRVYIIVLVTIILVSVISAGIVRASIPHFALTDENISDFRVSTARLKIAEMEIPKAEQLVSGAELIVTVSPKGNLEMKNGFVLSEVIVSSVILPNEKIKEGDTIFLYESMRVSPYEKNQFVSLNGTTNFMQQGEEYLVLLRFFDLSEIYDYTDKDLVTYIMVDGHFAEYPCGEYRYMVTQEGSDGNIPIFRDVAQYTNVFGSEEAREVYETLMEEIFMLIPRDIH